MLDSNLKRLTLWLLPVVCMIGLSMPVMAAGTNALDSSVAQPTFDAPVALAPGPPILFYKDFEVGNDVFDDALANLGLAGDVTMTADAVAFSDMLDDQDWACVIALNQNFPNTATFAAALTAYVGGGGSAIFTDWTVSFSGEAALYNAFEVAGTGANNQQPITTDGNPLWAGLPAAVGLTNPGWGTWSMGLATVGGGVGTGTFPNGDAAVVMGNGGATAFNGYLSDTFGVQAEGILFAENEINEICFPEAFEKEITSGPDRDGDGLIDLVVPINVEPDPPFSPVAYDYTITYFDPDSLPVWIYDRVPAEWDVTHIEFDGTGLPLDCGEETGFAGIYGMVDIWRGGKAGKKCNSDTGFRWMPNFGEGVQRFYWTEGSPGTVNRINADGTGATVLANTAASGGPLSRVLDVEIDQVRNVLYFNNWTVPVPSADEAIYRTDLNGAGQVTFHAISSSSPTGFASGLKRLAIDSSNGDVYFTRGVSYANPMEVSKADVMGAYIPLYSATFSDGWFPSGIDVDLAGGFIYWGDPTFTGVTYDGAINRMTTAGLAPVTLLGQIVPGLGRSLAFDPGFGPAGTVFVSAHDYLNTSVGGAIYSFDLASGGAALVFSDAGTGIPDIELDVQNQRIYWTDYVNGEIRSANYDGSGMNVEIAGLVNPSGLALEMGIDTTLNVQTLARCHEGGKGKKGKGGNTFCRPTSCGALYLNYGAIAFEKDEFDELVLDEFGNPIVVAGPTNVLCLAAVDDLNGGGLVWSGGGDEDGDTLTDLAEACEFGTDPCLEDTDGDGILDGVDDCPLEGPANPALGEILDPDGCIRQSECSDLVDNDGDGDIDYPADSSCDDLVDDSELTVGAACEPDVCGTYEVCDVGPGGNPCVCFATDPGITTGICVDDFFCAGAEDCSGDAGICAPLGKVCFYQTCCGAAFCGPAECTGVIQSADEMSLVPGPTATGL